MNKRGKWTVEVCDTKYPDIKTYNILEENLHPDMVYSGKHFGVCSSDSKEDAYLISAAPDMLEALKDLISIAEATHGAQDRVSRAKQAIAKAEGR